MTMTLDRPAPPRDGRPWLLLGVVMLVALALVALAVLVNAIARPGRPAHVVTAARGDRDAATLDLVSGAAVVTVRTADIGDDLYRVSTPDDRADVPRVSTQDDRVAVALAADDPDGAPGKSAVDLFLSRAVGWTVRISGGADAVRVDLRDGRVEAVDLASGVSTVELWLPRPDGTATVTETGGVSRFAVHVPPDVAARVTVAGGAGTADINGTVRSGVPATTTFDTPDWGAAAHRYDVRLVGGVSQFSLAQDLRGS
jgi:hypothetical protein